MSLLFLQIALFGNLWIWNIFNANVLLGVLIVVTTYLMIIFGGKKVNLVLVILFCLILFFQWKMTEKIDLVNLSNDEQRLQQQRLKEYPPVKISIGDKTLWILVAHWFEGRRESIAFFRIRKNFFENLDLNLYFFAGHPRERVGIAEFEKFLYVLLPLFLVGIPGFLKGKKYLFLLTFFLPLLLSAFIGNRNQLGPFSVFPFISTSIYSGGICFFQKTLKFSKSLRVLIFLSFFAVIILSFVQVISYAIF